MHFVFGVLLFNALCFLAKFLDGRIGPPFFHNVSIFVKFSTSFDEKTEPKVKAYVHKLITVRKKKNKIKLSVKANWVTFCFPVT